MYLPADDYENYREDFYLSALTGTDGLTAVNLRPETVYVADGVTLIPVSAGRTAVSFTNALGYSLRRLSIRVTDTAVTPFPSAALRGTAQRTMRRAASAAGLSEAAVQW